MRAPRVPVEEQYRLIMGHEDNREYGEPERLHALDAHVGINVSGQRLYICSRALVELGYDKVVDQLDALVAIKSKNEVIADIVALLQSPAKNVISALQSGGNTLHGVLKTLGERPEA